MSVRANRTVAEPRVVIYVISDQTGSSLPRRITPRRSQTDLVLFYNGGNVVDRSVHKFVTTR